MLADVEPTPYDLQFKLGSIPVRIAPWFWLVAAILGYNVTVLGLQYLLAWVVVLFVSILIHELGHAFAARSYGYAPWIVLHQFGGTAFYRPSPGRPRRESIAISFAGPAAGFLLWGVLRLSLDAGVFGFANQLSGEALQLLDFTLSQLLFINLWWGLVNLLPVLPLDGGQICRELCLARSRNGLEIASKIGVLVGGGVAIYCLTQDEIYIAVLFGLLCLQNIQSLQAGRGSQSPW